MLERSDRQLIGSSYSNKNPLGDRSLRGEYCIIFRVAYRVAYQCKMQHKL